MVHVALDGCSSSPEEIDVLRYAKNYLPCFVRLPTRMGPKDTESKGRGAKLSGESVAPFRAQMPHAVHAKVTAQTCPTSRWWGKCVGRGPRVSVCQSSRNILQASANCVLLMGTIPTFRNDGQLMVGAGQGGGGCGGVALFVGKVLLPCPLFRKRKKRRVLRMESWVKHGEAEIRGKAFQQGAGRPSC